MLGCRTLVRAFACLLLTAVSFSALWWFPQRSANDQLWRNDFVTTKNDPSGYISKAGKGHDGVADIRFTFEHGTTKAKTTSYGTGQLLPTGRHVLTAAHLTRYPLPGWNFHSGKVFFRQPREPEEPDVIHEADFSLGNIHVHPAFVGGAQLGDYCIVRLNGLVPEWATSRRIYRGSAEIGQVVTLPGVGFSGNGVTGYSQGYAIDDSKRRIGENRLDIDAAIGNTEFAACRGSWTAGNGFIVDFDNGKAVNDAIGALFGVHDLGRGDAEVLPAPGDSAGPAILPDGTIAGIVSGGCSTTAPIDVLAGRQGTFGEVCYISRMSSQQSWYDQTVPPVVREIVFQRIDQPGPPTYVVPTGSTEQLRSVAVGGPNMIHIRFSEHVNGITPFPSDAVTIQGKTQTYAFAPLMYGYSVSDYTASYGLPGTAYPQGFTWTETLPSGANKVHRGDALRITLKADRLVKPGSLVHLDGNFLPSPTRYWPVISSAPLPSGDGFAGTDLVFRVIILPGDFNRDNKVDLSDKGILDVNFGRTSGVAYTEGDGDGDCDLTDFGIYKDNFGLDWSTTWPGPP